jgi:dTDP-4-dehydrorhamnose 3,5-epimerase
MIFTETKLAGAYVVEADRFEDERGYFERTFVREEFEARGLDTRIVQTAVSYNRHRGTIRGMHYQADPHGQAKLVRCLRGAVYDVIIDLRADSATYRSWCAVELGAGSRRALYVPSGFAHGFQTLEDDTEVTYQISTVYNPASERGFAWNDPAFGIEWPLPATHLSDRDRSFPPAQTGKAGC